MKKLPTLAPDSSRKSLTDLRRSPPGNVVPIDRRTFVQAGLATTAVALVAPRAETASAAEPAAPPEITDTNIHLFDWPFRKLKYAKTDALINKLRKHRITKAWAGTFEAVLHKQLDAANRRLAEECQTHGDGMLRPIGSVNPAWPDWDEDLRRCHEQYRMPGIRLYPAYHGYTLDHPEFVRLLADSAQRNLLLQIVLRLEDERVHHVATNIPPLNVAPLVDALKKNPTAKVQLINSAGPLLGNNVNALIRDTQVTFDIAACESNGGVGKLLEGKNTSYRGTIPIDRLTFGSHAPFFPCESALLKLFESPLALDQFEKLANSNSRRLIA
ncbi:MAG TPA: amidohydrolase family protein [Pirellulaceae bacterium]